jgi:multidrug efflux pump subunit AcrA (membrane-fusion protein)
MIRSVMLACIVTFLAIACGGESVETGAEARGTVQVTGELRSANSHYFGPPPISDNWNFRIAYMAPEGERVDAGEPLLRFDIQDLMARLQEKTNALNEKKTELDKTRIVAGEQLADLQLEVEEARTKLGKARLKADIPEKLMAERDYLENQLLLRRAELEYELKQEELEKERIIQATEVEVLEREGDVLQVEANLLRGFIDAMTIIAPAPGVVIHGRDRRNNKTAVGDNVWGGRRIIEIPDLEKLQAHIEIPERDAARVKIGQQVRFTLDAVPDREFLGEIIELASVIHTRSINQPDKVFDARVRLTNPDTGLMRPGMNVNAEVIVSPVPERSGP